MIKILFPAFFIFIAGVFAVYAPSIAEGKEPKVIQTLSDNDGSNTTNQSSTADTSPTTLKQGKVISAFTEDSTGPQSSESSVNGTSAVQHNVEPRTSAQASVDSQPADTEKEYGQEYKVLKSQ